MTTATLSRSQTTFTFELDPRALVAPDNRHALPKLDDRGRLTLDEVLVGVWEGLRSDRTAACPVCGGAMLPRHGHGPRPVGGRCSDCSAELS
jgi:hypothetical protein